MERIDIKTDVPRVSIYDNIISSNAALPRRTPDMCACWNPAEIKKARVALKSQERVVCEDATAYLATISLSIEMLRHGKDVKAKIIKGWENK